MSIVLFIIGGKLTNAAKIDEALLCGIPNSVFTEF
jgi:hypothetical protein